MVLEYLMDEGFSKPAGPTIESHVHNDVCRGVTLECVTLQLLRVERQTLRRLKIVSGEFCEKPNNHGVSGITLPTTAGSSSWLS